MPVGLCYPTNRRAIFMEIAMKEIPLTQGKVAQVSDHRFDELSQWKWYTRVYKNTFYAARKENKKTIFMHRHIMKTPDNMQCDHWDGDGLNNQDDNLRNCTVSQNQSNRKINRNNTSGYKGVSWNTYSNSWHVSIMILGKRIFLGSFYDPKDAAIVYDKNID